MAPLFPLGIIDQGWYLVIIFLIGLFFGLVLEQSGFSSSRKLAGVFYGYDFVVLKVFFTAGITAMSGLVILGYFELIDLNLLNINSNFLLSAVTGGVIMGFGFILGGFCPGTSLTGAVIGKIDAMVFVVGVFLGIFIFGLTGNTFNSLFSGYYFDRELISETLGVGKHFMVFVWIVMALASFGVASWFEKRSTKGLVPTNKKFHGLFIEVGLAIAIAVIILILPQKKSKGLLETDEYRVTTSISDSKLLMSPDELSYLMINNPGSIKIIDVRDQKSFAEFNIPGSENIPIELITQKEYNDLFNDKYKKTVLICKQGITSARARVLLAREGFNQIQILDGGLDNLVKTIFFDNTAPDGTFAYDEISRYRFRKRAADIFSGKSESELPATLRSPATRTTPVTVLKPSSGGC